MKIIYFLLCAAILLLSCEGGKKKIDLEKLELKGSKEKISLDSSKFDRRMREITFDIIKVNYVCAEKRWRKHISLHDLYHLDMYDGFTYEDFDLSSRNQDENYWQDKFLVYEIYNHWAIGGGNTYTDSVFFFAVSEDDYNIYFLDGYCFNEINRLITAHISPIDSPKKAYKVGRFFVKYSLNYSSPLILIDNSNYRKYLYSPDKNDNYAVFGKIKLPEMIDYGDHYTLVIFSIYREKRIRLTFKNTIIMNKDSIAHYKRELIYEDYQLSNIKEMIRKNPEYRKRILNRVK